MLTILSLLSVLALGQSTQSARTPVPLPASSEQIPGLDQALAKLAAEEYAFSSIQGELGAPNRAQDLRVKVSALGLTVEPLRDENWKLVLRTKSVGRVSTPHRDADAGPGVLTSSGVRAQIAHGEWTEWFENRQDGIEQGWTIVARPAGEGPLYVKLCVEGDLSLRIADATGGRFHRANGELALRYVGLMANDASGQTVRAQLVSRGGDVAIEVDDAGATYPLTIDPLITGPVWTYESNDAEAQAGYSVTVAGDVNADGYSDVLIGAPFWWAPLDPGYSVLLGRVMLFLGSSNGLTAAPVWHHEGLVWGAGFGTTCYLGLMVTAAGDVNGDGYDDVIATSRCDGSEALLFTGCEAGLQDTPRRGAYITGPNAYFESISGGGDVNGDGFDDFAYAIKISTEIGLANLRYGSVGGLVGGWQWWVGDWTSPVQIQLCLAGDLDGDGYDDLVLGVPDLTGTEPEQGELFVFRGDVNGLHASPDMEIWGPHANTRLGESVARAGDVNGDGYADVIVGSAVDVRVYLGSSSGLSTSHAWSIPNLGSAVSAGDVNGDGYADVMVATPGSDSVSVYLGSSTGLATTAAWTAVSGSPGTGFGTSLSGAGDVNGDGFGDVVVGALDYSNGETREGRTYVFQGGTAGMSSFATWSNPGSQAGGEYGASVSLVGDLNADGFSDYVVGANREDSVNGQKSGRAHVYLGENLFTLPTPAGSLNGPSADAGFGNWVAGAGDMNGDGYDDFLVGARDASNGESGEGMVFAYYGSASGFDPTPASTFESNQAEAGMGQCVANAGDINGDGYSDVLIGTFKWDDAAGLDQGRADLYLGSATGLGSTSVWSILGQDADDQLGSNVSGAGDVNGDGYSDFVVSASSGGASGAGYVYCYLGTDAGPTGPVWAYDVPQVGAQVGSIAACGDVNGDGYSDIVLGLPQWDGALDDQGQALVFYGGGPGPDANPSWSTLGLQAGCYFGTTVAAAGDVNDDGYSDLLVTAIRYAIGQTDEGAAFVYLGSATGLAATPVWTAEGNQDGARLGATAIGPGDVNGDGFSDILIGAPGFGLLQQLQGSVLLYLGNGAVRGGSPVGARPVTLSGSPLALRGATSDVNFKIRAHANGAQATASTPGGRGRARLEWQIAKPGKPLSSEEVQSGSWSPTGPVGSSLTLESQVQGTGSGLDIWRVRTGFGDPLFPHGPWLSMPGNAQTELDLRSSMDCNGNGLPDAAEPDCNSNGDPDSCDISRGVSPDCNANGVPDSCELATGGLDCNANGILDACDIASGFMQDINRDGIPDSCQSQFASTCWGDGNGTPCPCSNVSASGRGCPNSTDAQGALLQVSGFPSQQYDTLVLSGSGMREPSTVLYIQGTGLHNGGFGLQYGDGLACVGGTVIRLGWRTNVAGASTFGPGIATIGQIPNGGGVTRYYAAWYRDGSPSYCTANRFNFTNAVSVVWVP